MGDNIKTNISDGREFDPNSLLDDYDSNEPEPKEKEESENQEDKKFTLIVAFRGEEDVSTPTLLNLAGISYIENLEFQSDVAYTVPGEDFVSLRRQYKQTRKMVILCTNEEYETLIKKLENYNTIEKFEINHNSFSRNFLPKEDKHKFKIKNIFAKLVCAPNNQNRCFSCMIEF